MEEGGRREEREAAERGREEEGASAGWEVLLEEAAVLSIVRRLELAFITLSEV